MEMLRLSKKLAGFSLIEVVIASGILLVSVTSIMSLALYSQKNSHYLLEKSFASVKAAEGIEMARYIRAKYWSDGAVNNWLANGEFFKSANDIGADKINDSYSFANKTFTRAVTVSDCANLSPSVCRKLTSQVTWSGGKIELEEELTDWKIDS